MRYHTPWDRCPSRVSPNMRSIHNAKCRTAKRNRRELSTDSSLGACTLLSVVEKIGLKNRRRGCVNLSPYGDSATRYIPLTAAKMIQHYIRAACPQCRGQFLKGSMEKCHHKRGCAENTLGYMGVFSYIQVNTLQLIPTAGAGQYRIQASQVQESFFYSPLHQSAVQPHHALGYTL